MHTLLCDAHASMQSVRAASFSTMAAAGSGRRARKRPRGDAGQPAPEPAQDGKELSAWQIADLPAAQSKLKRGVWSKAEDDLLRDLFNAECDARGMDEEAKKVSHAAVSMVAAVPAPAPRFVRSGCHP